MSKLIVSVIEDPAGFERLQPEWNELHKASASPCLFLTWEWLFTWWKHLSEGRKLFMVTVRRDGELVAIAPLALRPPRLSRLLPFRSLEFMGTGSVGSNYLDVIIRRGREQEVLQALTDYLKHGKLMLKLADLRMSSSFVAMLATQLHQRSWNLSQAKTSICPFIKLSGHSWESYLGTLGQKKRYNIRRDLRRMANQFDLRLEQVLVEEQRQEALAQLVSLHNMRWRDRGGTNAFHTPGLLSFHEELSRLALERGWLRLFTLWLNGKPAASLYGFMFHRTFYFYQSGFNPTHSTLSLGTIMVALTVMSAIEEGAEEYDFLGGDEQYKFHLAREARELGLLELYPPGARGLFYRQAMMLRQAVKRIVWEVTPPAFADRIASVQHAEM